MIEPINCVYCQVNQATKLFYYSKLYPSNLDTIESPIICCDICAPKARDDLSIVRGGIEGFHIISFGKLGRMSDKEIAFLCSKKGKEINHLSNKIWKQLIFRIHYLNRPKHENT